MNARRFVTALLTSAFALGIAASASAQPLPVSDIPAGFKPSDDMKDFTIREAEIPMRDGTKLHTNIVIPRGAKNAPIIFSRTPYGADKAITGAQSNRSAMALPTASADLAEAR